jgi:hypothetical protein
MLNEPPNDPFAEAKSEPFWNRFLKNATLAAGPNGA